MYFCMYANDFFDTNWFKFLKDKFLNAIFIIIDFINKSSNHSDNVVRLFLDAAKSFDSIAHDILSIKLIH